MAVTLSFISICPVLWAQATPQTITFGALGTKNYGAAAFSAGASASSGLAVSYTSSNPFVATVSSSGVITIVGVGETDITASQAGDSNYLAAVDVTQILTVQSVLSSVDGATISLDFQVADMTGYVSHANGWSTNDEQFRPDGYASDGQNPGNILGLIGGAYTAPANLTTELTYNYNPGNSDYYVFQWNQNITSSQTYPGDDIFGWKFMSGSNTAFSIRFLNDNSTGRDLLVQGYDGLGNALTLASGQPNDEFFDRDDPLDNFGEAINFRVTADLAAKKWSLDILRTNNTWFGLVDNASIDPSLTSLDGMAATWTVADNTFDGTQYSAAGDNYMSFDNITIQGKQTVVINLNIPTNAVYNGLGQAVTATTTPTNIAVVIKYDGSTNIPVNANTNGYSVTAEVVDTNTYYNAPTSGSLVVAKATPTITAAPTASAIDFGQTLASSSLTGGSASVAGTFAFTDTSIAPAVGTANQGVTFTPTDTANYNTATTSVSVTVNSVDTPWDTWADSYSLANGTDRAKNSDPDGDGFDNATEFAFGLNPTVREAEVFSATPSGGNYVVTFKKRKLASEATYDFRSSTDLTQAFSAGTALTPGTATSVDANYEQVSVSIPITGTRGFIRGQATVLVDLSR